MLVPLCIHLPGYAQSKPAGPVIATPNAASIALAGEVPVSYFTGLPAIDVPLYTIRERGLVLPLALSYHAQGFRPDLHPSWVGANWSLQAGGAITRKLNNLPDEWKSDDYNINGYYYSHDRLNNPAWSSTDTLAWLNPVTVAAEKWQDREPDEFGFNFLDFSGKFFLDHLGKWRVQCDKNLEVMFSEEDLVNPFFHNSVPAASMPFFKPKVFGKFTLVDDSGIQYVFGKTESTDGIEYSSSITPPDLNYRTWLIATSWHLAEIRFPDQTGIITINYERGPFQSNFQYFESQNRFFVSRCTPAAGGTSSYDAKGLSGTITSPVYPTAIYTTSGVKAEFYFSRSNEMQYPSSTYLEVFRDEQGRLPAQQSPPSSVPPGYFSFMLARNEVPFYVQNGIWADGIVSNDKFAWFKLDSLVIIDYDLNNNMARTPFQRMSFRYRENPNERLKLESVAMYGAEPGQDSLQYVMKYNDWGSAAPGYVADLTDHWGFANNKPLKKDPQYGGYQWYGENMLTSRSPDETATRIDILKELLYPTGGKVAFEYEPNRYGKYMLNINRGFPVPGEGIAGGLRIKRITQDDGAGNLQSREFFYVNGYSPGVLLGSLNSSGVLDGKPGFSNYNYTINQNGLYLSVYSSNAIVPVSANSGAFCGYSEVTERFSDSSYKTYRFTNHDNGYADDNAVNTITPVELGVPYRSRSFERGKLLSESVYSASGSLVQSTDYTYQRKAAGADSNLVRSLRKEYGGYCTTFLGSGLNPYIGQASMGYQLPVWNGFFISPESFHPSYTTATAYGYYVYRFLPQTITKTNYPSPGQTGTAMISTTSFEYDEKANLIKTLQTGSQEDTITRQFKYPYHFAGQAVYDTMVSRHMNGLMVESATYRQSVFTEKEMTRYELFNNGKLVKPGALQKQRAGNPAYTDVHFYQYDEKGNVLDMQGPDGIRTSYVWSYFKSRPLAKISGLPYSSVEPLLDQQALTFPSGGDAMLLAEADKLRTQLPSARVSAYLYDARSGWNLKQEKDMNGRNTFYKYDVLGRLAVVSDNDNHILSKNDYRYRAYAAYTFLNTEKSGLFQSQLCSPGYRGSYLYTVPEGKYGSYSSQAEADIQAQQDVDRNGQAAANAQAVCVPYYNYQACCGWGVLYSSFEIAGNGNINFSLVLTKSGGGSFYNVQTGTLSGQLFLPSASRNISFSSQGVSGVLTINPGGEVRLSVGNTNGLVQINGSYSL